MPAKTEKQRKMMAIAEHHPEKLYKKNRGVLKMSKKELHKFASKKDRGFHSHMEAPTLGKRMIGGPNA